MVVYGTILPQTQSFSRSSVSFIYANVAGIATSKSPTESPFIHPVPPCLGGQLNGLSCKEFPLLLVFLKNE